MPPYTTLLFETEDKSERKEDFSEKLSPHSNNEKGGFKQRGDDIVCPPIYICLVAELDRKSLYHWRQAKNTG